MKNGMFKRKTERLNKKRNVQTENGTFKGKMVVQIENEPFKPKTERL